MKFYGFSKLLSFQYESWLVKQYIITKTPNYSSISARARKKELASTAWQSFTSKTFYPYFRPLFSVACKQLPQMTRDQKWSVHLTSGTLSLVLAFYICEGRLEGSFYSRLYVRVVFSSENYLTKYDVRTTQVNSEEQNKVTTGASFSNTCIYL